MGTTVRVESVDGELLRYWVKSSSRAGVRHLVDLAENRGLGQCSCEAFNFNLLPKAREGGGTTVAPQFQCKHIKAASWRLIQDIVQNERAKEERYRQEARQRRLAGQRFTGGEDEGVPEGEADVPF